MPSRGAGRRITSIAGPHNRGPAAEGFFLPVVPGTKFVTFGGAIASDVHGKNHHIAGSFGNHTLWLDLLTLDGDVRRCSPGSDVSLFQATLGGMGLTGIVLRAAIRLLPIKSGWIRQRTIVAPRSQHRNRRIRSQLGQHLLGCVDRLSCPRPGTRAQPSLSWRACQPSRPTSRHRRSSIRNSPP